MRIRTSNRALLALLSGTFLAVAAPLGAQNGYTLHPTGASGNSGTTVQVHVLLDNTSTGLDGWSFGICHNPAVLSVQTAVLGPAANSVAPVFVTINPGLAGGVTVGVVIDFVPPFTQLAAGIDLNLLDITYTLIGAPGSSSQVTPCNTLGSPPVAVLVVTNTIEIIPAQVAATVSIASAGPRFVRGDANRDGLINIVDAVRILELLFLTADPLVCADEVDTNDDGSPNLVDVVYLLQSLFLAGPAVPPPFPTCGPDPTGPDAAGCTVSSPMCP